MGCVNNSHSLRMIQFSDSLNFTVASAVSSCLEAATGGVLLGKVFLKISQNSQENICAFLCTCFPVNFVKFLRTPIL